MRHLFHLLVTLSVVLANLQSHGGAVSAGGRVAAAKLECLFNDPKQRVEPYNFIAFSVGDSAILNKVNLQTKKSSESFSFNEITQTSNGALRVDAQTDQTRVQITVQDSKPLTYEQYIGNFQVYQALPKVQFVTGITGYQSVLQINGSSFNGICAKQYLFFYEVGR